MSSTSPADPQKKQRAINTTIAVLAGQVGCLTLVVLAAAVLGGMWLDARLGSKPTFTVGLLLVSIPVSVILMLVVARKAIAKIKTQPQPQSQPTNPQSARDEEAVVDKKA